MEKRPHGRRRGDVDSRIEVIVKLVVLAALLVGCAASHSPDDTCAFECETAITCDAPSMVLRACEIDERGYRNVFCDSRELPLESLADPCIRSCRARGACGWGEDVDSLHVHTCECEGQ
jgi:hypothetical protein